MRGKGKVTLRDVLTFTARLPACGGARPAGRREPAHDGRAARTAQPGGGPAGGRVLHGPWTAGWIVAEVVRRVDGRDLDLFFLEEIAGPLGLDVHFGLVPDQLPHAARISYDPGFRARFPAPDGGPDDGAADLFGRVWNNPSPFPADAGVWSRTRRRYAIVPSLGAYASARGLARLQGVLAADAVRAPGEEPLLLSRRTLDQARSFWVEGLDPLLGGQRVRRGGPATPRRGPLAYGPRRGLRPPGARRRRLPGVAAGQDRGGVGARPADGGPRGAGAGRRGGRGGAGGAGRLLRARRPVRPGPSPYRGGPGRTPSARRGVPRERSAGAAAPVGNSSSLRPC